MKAPPTIKEEEEMSEDDTVWVPDPEFYRLDDEDHDMINEPTMTQVLEKASSATYNLPGVMTGEPQGLTVQWIKGPEAQKQKCTECTDMQRSHGTNSYQERLKCKKCGWKQRVRGAY